MKKWMAYLPLGLLCGSLVVIGGIWGSVWNHTWSGQLELRHLKGDEKALADFDIQFGITDVRQRWNFSIAEMEFFHQGWRFAERILYPVL